jgi:hypothetical protein
MDNQSPYSADLLPQRCAQSPRVLAAELTLKQMPSPTMGTVTLAEVAELYKDHKRGILLRDWRLPENHEQVIYRMSVPNAEMLQL